MEDGEVLMKIEKYVLIINNIIYVVSGFKLCYWDFFLVDDIWGIIFVWGFGEVIESKYLDVFVGECCYGYFLMSSYLKVKLIKVNEVGFWDGIVYWNFLFLIYNYYMWVNNNFVFYFFMEDFMLII